MAHPAKVLALVLAGTGLAMSCPAQSSKSLVDKIVAVVGDRIILRSDIENAVADAQRTQQQSAPNSSCFFTQQALVTNLLTLEAEKDSLTIDNDAVENEIDQRIRYWIKKLGSRQALEETAQKTISQLREESRITITDQRLADLMREKLTNNVKITPAEIRDYFGNIAADDLPFVEAKYVIGQIVFEPLSSPSIEEYVKSELYHFKKMVENGTATFAQLAKRYSEDPDSRSREGYSEIDRNDKDQDPRVMTSLLKLKEAGIAEPFKGRDGRYYLYQLIARDGDIIAFRQIVKDPPVSSEAFNSTRQQLDSIKEQLVAGTINFKTAVSRLNEKAFGSYIVNGDGNIRVSLNEIDRETMVMVEKLKQGEFSAPHIFEAPDGRKRARLIYLEALIPAHRLNLTDDWEQVADWALREKKTAALEKWFKSKIESADIILDGETAAACPAIRKFIGNGNHGF